MIRTYTELSKLQTFRERFEYLKLGGEVGARTFGFDRYLNQALYTSPEWKKTRRGIILRDGSCDLGIEGYEIDKGVIVHHMNPITIEQIENRDPIIFDPEFLILTVLQTHNAIHYADESFLVSKELVTRRQDDTCPWR